MISRSALVAPMWLALPGLLQQTQVPSAAPPVSVCMTEGEKLVGSQPIQARGKVDLPKRRTRVDPLIQSVPPEPPAASRVWIGEALVDTKGLLVHVWTLREP